MLGLARRLKLQRQPLFPEDWLVRGEYVDEVLGLLRPGKESEVFLVARSVGARTTLLAEKRFKPRAERSFRNDSLYIGGWAEGRRREHRAIRKRSPFGRRLIESRWSGKEWAELVRVHAAGATVPPPVEETENGYLMAFVGDDGVAAPRLAEVRLDWSTAERLLRELLDEIALFLACDRVHGDLSPYNVLYWRGRAVVIDFSQTVDVRHPQADALLRRDVERLCAYFARNGVRADQERVLRDLTRPEMIPHAAPTRPEGGSR